MIYILHFKMATLICMEKMAHLEGSGLHIECSIQERLMQQCCVRVWAVILHTKDMPLLWAHLYGKCPGSLKLMHVVKMYTDISYKSGIFTSEVYVLIQNWILLDLTDKNNRKYNINHLEYSQNSQVGAYYILYFCHMEMTNTMTINKPLQPLFSCKACLK